MSDYLEESYFVWLYENVASSRTRLKTKTHWSLLKQMHDTPFTWLVPNDDNRIEDGRDLRYEYLRVIQDENPDHNWLSLECSMLEMLIAFSRRLAFEDGSEPRLWFWHMCQNLKLQQYNDANYSVHISEIVNETLERVIRRTYLPNGVGGLFPLTTTNHDQRNVELWYQFCEYLQQISQ